MKPLTKVIDYNAVGSRPQPLEDFFLQCPDNVAVVTDIMAIECLKRDSLANYRQSFKILSRYSERVIVLKPFTSLRNRPPQKDRFYHEIVDREFTCSFPEYCTAILNTTDPTSLTAIERARSGVFSMTQRLTELANTDLRSMIRDSEKIISPAQLCEWRSGKPISLPELAFAHRNIAATMTALFSMFFPDRPRPSVTDGPYWLVYPYAVALQALTLWWIRKGGYMGVSAPKLRNDSIDIFYAAYGTLFQGVITSDTKLLEITDLSNAIIRYSRSLNLNQPYSVRKNDMS